MDLLLRGVTYQNYKAECTPLNTKKRSTTETTTLLPENNMLWTNNSFSDSTRIPDSL